MVQNMVDSSAPLQLVTTYNEYGEGTATESSRAWASSSDHGMYMDGLHDGMEESCKYGSYVKEVEGDGYSISLLVLVCWI